MPKTWVTVALLLACAAVPYLAPGMARYRVLDPPRLLDTLVAPWRGNPLSKVFRSRENVRAARPLPADNGSAMPHAPRPPMPRLAAGPAGLGADWPSAEEENDYAADAAGLVGVEDYGNDLPRFYGRLWSTERKARISSR